MKTFLISQKVSDNVITANSVWVPSLDIIEAAMKHTNLLKTVTM